MENHEISLKELKALAQKWVEARGWQKFHNPKNDSMNIVREATELAELFIWDLTAEESYEQAEKLRTAMEDEVGDILFSLLAFCTYAKVDLQKAFLTKLEKSAKKYPLDKTSPEEFAKIKYGSKV